MCARLPDAGAPSILYPGAGPRSAAGGRDAPAPRHRSRHAQDQTPLRHRPRWRRRLPRGVGAPDRRDGAEGWGEADPSKYYGETADTVLAVLRRLEPHLPKDAFELEAAEARFAQVVPKNGAARAALSAALHDLFGKRLGQIGRAHV